METRKPIEKVGVICKKKLFENPKTLKVIKSLVRYLKFNKKEIFLDTNSCLYFPKTIGQSKDELLKNTDLVITFGGDGTLLKTARHVSRKKVLILGVNMGNVGFLTECPPDKLLECLDKIFSDQYQSDRRSLLRVTIYRNNKKSSTFLALNDVVINQGSFARLIGMEIEVNGRKLVKFKADGMIVATPTGSTAHSLSAGGTIVHPNIEGLIITPICPSSLSMRSIVVPDSRQLTITIETKRREEDSSIIGLTIDGQDFVVLKYGDVIKVRRSKRYVYLARTKNAYYKTLRNKLNWGEL